MRFNYTALYWSLNTGSGTPQIKHKSKHARLHLLSSKDHQQTLSSADNLYISPILLMSNNTSPSPSPLS